MNYELKDLLNKYVVIGTPEAVVFLDECERLGVKAGRFGTESPVDFAKDKQAVKVLYIPCLGQYTLTQTSVSYLKSINSEPFKLKDIASDADELVDLREKLEAMTAERDQLAAKLAKMDELATRYIEDSEEIAEFFDSMGGIHLVIAQEIRDIADEMADVLTEQTAKGGA